MRLDHPAAIPLCVDLDGTLLAGDITWEATKMLLWKAPWAVCLFPFWGIRGRPYFKQKLSERVTIDPAKLSYRLDVVQFLEEEQGKGRRIVLATAAGEAMVRGIVGHLKFLDPQIVATGLGENLSGSKKARELVKLFGEKGFDYAGNEIRDLAIWKHARKAIVVHAPGWVLERATKVCEIEKVFA